MAANQKAPIIPEGEPLYDVHGEPLPFSPGEKVGYFRKFHRLEAKCKFCPQAPYLIRSGGTKTTSWSGAMRHLRDVHKIGNEEGLAANLREHQSLGVAGVPRRGIERYMGISRPGTNDWQHCVDALAKLVAVDNLPLHVGHRVAFVKFLRELYPRFPRISPASLTRAVTEMAKRTRERIANELRTIHKVTDIAWTGDLWTSANGDCFLTYSAHWIDDDWRLRWRVLATQKFPGQHTASNISARLINARTSMGILPRDRQTGAVVPQEIVLHCPERFYMAESHFDRLSITTDCASDVSAGCEKDELFDWNRCVCHCLHNAVAAGLALPDVQDAVGQLRGLGVNMRRSRLALDKFKRIQTGTYSTIDIGQQDIDIDATGYGSGSGGGSSEVDDVDDGDALHEEIIVDCSDSMACTNDRMGHVCAHKDATLSIATGRPLKLIVPGDTRWNSTYMMLERGLRLRREITTFLGTVPLKRMVDARERARAWNENLNKLVPVHIGPECWSTYEALVQVLKPIKIASKVMESSTRVTISEVLPALTHLMYKTMAHFEPGGIAARFAGAVKGKLISFLDDKNQFYNWVLASSLDGRFTSPKWLKETVWSNRSEWPNVVHAWPTLDELVREVDEEIANMLQHYGRHCKRGTPGSKACHTQSPSVCMPSYPSERASSILFGDFMRAATSYDKDGDPGNMSDTDASLHYKEIVTRWRNQSGNHVTPEDYDKCGTRWWAANAGLFPEIANIARRRLCVQASSATSERAFSKAGLVCSKQRMSLLPRKIEDLTCLSWDLVQSGWGPSDLDDEKSPRGHALNRIRRREHQATQPLVSAARKGGAHGREASNRLGRHTGGDRDGKRRRSVSSPPHARRSVQDAFQAESHQGKKTVRRHLFDDWDDSDDWDNRPLKRGTWQRRHRLRGQALKAHLSDGSEDSEDPIYICSEDSDI